MKAPAATASKPFTIHQAIISLCPRKPLMLQIEWKSSHYHSDGRRRSRPKASTVHGWLVKWRATFSGNERLRKEGIREMREAKAVREWKKQRKAARLAKAETSNGLSHLWPITFGEKKKRKTHRSKTISRDARTSPAKRPSNGGTQYHTSPTHSPSPTFANGRRPSQSRRESGNRHRNVRKASHSSSNIGRGHKGSIRTSKKER